MTATESLAAYSVPEHHVKMYTSNVRAAIHKQGGLLVPLVSMGSYKGEKVALVNFLGPVEFIERTTVYGDTKITEVEHTQRWISASEYDCAILIDRLDTLKMIYDPTSPYVERMREAAARRMDKIVMDKFFATAKSGKEGTTDISFPAADTVVHGSTGLVLTKLRSLRKLIKKRHVDLRSTRPMIAVTAEQVDNLIAETTTSSIDFNTVKPLADGEVTNFMGFNFVPYEDSVAAGYDGIPNHTDTGHVIRECPVWVPDGMHFGLWDALTVIINNRPDKNNIKQIHATFTAGATRVEEGKVFKLECQET
jgi:hypothetical protein